MDAGIDLRSEISVRPGMRVLRSATPLAPDALRELDLVIVDERAWRSLGAAGRNDLKAAVAQGWASSSASPARCHRENAMNCSPLASMCAPSMCHAATRLASAPTEMTRRPLQVTAGDGVPLLRSDRGEPLALWRAEGQGRVALWWLSDSFRLTLDGSSAAYGTLWSHALSTVARARGQARTRVPGRRAAVHRRQVLCGVDADASVRDA